jgi:hypothetical protein
MINWKTETVNKEHRIISNQHLTETVISHKTQTAFAKRPLTTYFIEVLAFHTPLTIGEAFVAVNFGLLFFCGIALFYLARLLLENTQLSNFSVLFFFLSFTVLFSFFPTNYSYDEPLQYLLIFLSLAALVRKKWGLFILCFSLSLIARESSIILLPAIAWYFMEFEWKNLFRSESIKKILAVILPVIIYAVFLYVITNMLGIGKESTEDLNGRFSHFLINFQNQEYAVESLLSLALAVGVQVYFLLSYLADNPLSPMEKKLVKAFLLSLIFNTIIVLSTTLARETRLFALPLVFIWPIFGKILLHELKILGSAKNYGKLFSNILSVGTLILLWALCFLIYRFIYIQTNGIRKNNLDEYLLILSALISLHLVMKMRLKYDKSLT